MLNDPGIKTIAGFTGLSIILQVEPEAVCRSEGKDAKFAGKQFNDQYGRYVA